MPSKAAKPAKVASKPRATGTVPASKRQKTPGAAVASAAAIAAIAASGATAAVVPVVGRAGIVHRPNPTRGDQFTAVAAASRGGSSGWIRPRQ